MGSQLKCYIYITTTLTLNAPQAHGTDGQCEPVEVSVLWSDLQTGHGLLLLPQQHTVLLGNMPSRSPGFTLKEIDNIKSHTGCLIYSICATNKKSWEC